MLVAATDQPRAATVLARRLLAHADRNQLAVIARPRNPQVAGMYRAPRFAPLPPAAEGSCRVLIRPPRGQPSSLARGTIAASVTTRLISRPADGTGHPLLCRCRPRVPQPPIRPAHVGETTR